MALAPICTVWTRCWTLGAVVGSLSLNEITVAILVGDKTGVLLSVEGEGASLQQGRRWRDRKILLEYVIEMRRVMEITMMIRHLYICVLVSDLGA